MSGRSSAPKEIFVVHTRGERWHRELFEEIKERLSRIRFRPWSYSDWDWYELIQDDDEPEFAATGFEIDPLRFVTRHPEPFIAGGGFARDVNRAALRKLMLGSCAILFLEPTAVSISPGIREELGVMARGLSLKSPPIVISVLTTRVGRSILPGNVPVGARLILSDPAESISRGEVNRLLCITSLVVLCRLLSRKTTPAVFSFLLGRAIHQLPLVSDVIRSALPKIDVDLAAAENESKSRETWTTQQLRRDEHRARDAGISQQVLSDGERDRLIAEQWRAAADILCALSAEWWQDLFPRLSGLTEEYDPCPERDAFGALLEIIDKSFEEAWSRFRFLDVPK
jgi:hypothetical protein